MALPLLLLFAISSCTNRDEPRAPSADSDATGTKSATPIPSGPQPTVVFETTSGEVKATAEVVRSEAKIRRGLMYRRHMPENTGMLFLFDREKVQSFWMKNTLISLDMIFIRADMTVAGVKANTPPKTFDSQRVDTPSQFVFEVNAGWAAKNGVAKGAAVRFENVGEVPLGVPML